ncbi:hypothetical protein [Streptomyces sp. NPDC006638]|uniref:hypothetical protein n=1 Tax=Streptomyces sp. NPDC006638 TaxID=3157183 RepID=UPI00339FFFE4
MANCLLCERYDDTGSYLCPLCTKQTRVRLECLPDLYAGLLPFLTPAAGGGQGRGSRPVFAPLPVTEDVLDLRGPGGLVGVAEHWLAIISKERGAGGTVSDLHLTIEARLKAAVAELLAHLVWVAVSWPDAGVFAEDIRQVTESVRSIIEPRVPVDRGTRVGNCPAEHDDGAICGAVLRLLPGARVVTCSWCGCSYPPAMWAGLKVLIDEDDAAAKSAEQVAG